MIRTLYFVILNLAGYPWVSGFVRMELSKHVTKH